MKHLFCLILICDMTLARAQHTEPALYRVGYENLFMTDSSRTYKPGSCAEDKLHYRPLEIDCWYPAAPSGSGPAIEYGEFLGLLQERSNRFQDYTVYTHMTKDLIGSLCTGLNMTDTAGLRHLKTLSHEHALPILQPFPLIIYLCSYNGMSFENIHLLDNLASHGYTVASITSVGRYPGDMSMDTADLLEQVKDGLFAIEQLRKRDNVDREKIGLIGYSWGGLAAILLSMKSNDASAIRSQE